MKRVQFILLTAAIFISGCFKDSSDYAQGFIEGEFTYISSAVAGHLTTLSIDRGAKVKKGTPLFTLEPEPEQAQLQAATADLARAEDQLNNLKRGERSSVLMGIEARLAQAKADLDFAQSELTRNQRLYETRIISGLKYDQLKANFKAATEKVNQIKAELSEAKLGAREDLILAQQAAVDVAAADVKELTWRLAQKTATSNVEGLVFDTFFVLGEFVPAGSPVLALLLPENIKLVFYVPQTLLSKIQIGKEVTLTCPGCQMATARIEYISPEAEFTPPVIYSKETREKLMFRVEAQLSKEGIKYYHPGQPVDVEIDI
ncbi:MAG: periplasmic component of efflux system [Gammaproteobacteria bacterium]|nr:periplasmic component of efflux system [Gammaproteobacteria bacterium]